LEQHGWLHNLSDDELGMAAEVEFGEGGEGPNLSDKKQLILKFENCIVKKTL
jgi:hypothetical protein